MNATCFNEERNVERNNFAKIRVSYQESEILPGNGSLYICRFHQKTTTTNWQRKGNSFNVRNALECSCSAKLIDVLPKGELKLIWLPFMNGLIYDLLPINHSTFRTETKYSEF